MTVLRSLAIVLIALCAVPVTAKDTYAPLDILLSSPETVIGQGFEYPDGEAKITAAIVTMAPGQSTGWHRHPVPLFGYVLEGELTVDYGADGKQVYKAGDSLIEAFGTLHNGTNTGEGPMRILAVFAGAEGVQNTIPEVQSDGAE